MDLAGLPQFHLAVHGDHAAGDQVLAGTAAVDDTDELEQLVEFDVIVPVQGEFEALHSGRGPGVWGESGGVTAGGAQYRPPRVAGVPMSTPDGEPAASLRFADLGLPPA